MPVEIRSSLEPVVVLAEGIGEPREDRDAVLGEAICVTS